MGRRDWENEMSRREDTREVENSETSNGAGRKTSGPQAVGRKCWRAHWRYARELVTRNGC
jgi:hypothetical protein